MTAPTWQSLSLDEYQQRLDALRGRMQDRDVDVMLVHTPENLFYLTGYQTLVVPLAGEPVFITRGIEESNVLHLSCIEESRPYGDSEDWVARTRDVLVEIGSGSTRVGVEKDSWFLTVRDLERLSGMLPEATFVDCSRLVEAGRVVKSPAGLEYMRQAAGAAEAGMEAGIVACKDGAGENEVAAAIHHAQIVAGSEYTGLPVFITSGARSALTHATWYRQEMKTGDTVFLEVPGCINRYHVALMRTVHLGQPPDRMVAVTEAMGDALQKTIDFIKPGTTAREAHRFCEQSIADADLGVVMEHRAAYSIGIAFAPDWGEGQIISMMEREQRALEAGMTFHLIPQVFIPGLSSVGVSETIHVTEDGCEPLMPNIDRRLFVA